METFAIDRGEPELLPLSGYEVIRQVQDHAMFLLDRTGRTASWNEGVRTVFGYDQDEWIGLPLRHMFTPEDRDAGAAEHELTRALEMGRADDDRPMVRRSGDRFVAAGTVTRIVDDRGGHLGFLKVVRDQTESLHAVDERSRLLRSERDSRLEAERQAAALTAAIESIPDGVCIGDTSGVVRCNMAALQILGASSIDDLKAAPEAVARTFRVRRHRSGGELPAHELPFSRALEGETAVVDAWVTKKTTGEDVFIRGTAAPIVVEGQVVGAVAVNSDLTYRLQFEEKEGELSRAETALREREEQLRAVFTGVRDYAIFTVGVDGKISSWHEGAALMKGYTAEEAVGMPFANLFTPEDRRRGQPEREMALAARTGEYKGEGTRMRANGDLFDASVVLTALRAPNGELLGYLKLTQDITDRRRLEQQREETLRNAESARVNAERVSHMMGEFLATISHELRTPLGAILGWAHMLSRDAPNESTLKQGLVAITRNARAQVKLVEDLLDLSRIESGQLRLDVCPVVPADVIANAIDAVLPSARAKGVDVRTVLDPRAIAVSADPDRLQQIVWNLLTNAVKFTPRNGKVTVTVSATADTAEIAVADTGQGIDPGFIARMFDRFQQQDATTTRQQGGLGIGLAITRQLVELHGGSIRAESAGLDRGATFTIALPLREGLADNDDQAGLDALAGEGPVAHGEERALAGISVLLIEDEPDARDVTGYMLRHAGARVFDAASASDGFELLRRERPDVIVCDIGMPEHDGYDFIAWVRGLSQAEGGRTPAMAFTAFSRTEDRELAVSRGFHMHLSKPAEAEELIEAVGSLAKIA